MPVLSVSQAGANNDVANTGPNENVLFKCSVTCRVIHCVVLCMSVLHGVRLYVVLGCDKLATLCYAVGASCVKLMLGEALGLTVRSWAGLGTSNLYRPRTLNHA